MSDDTSPTAAAGAAGDIGPTDPATGAAEVGPLWRRSRFWRWTIPVIAAAAVALLASSVLSANANPNLPNKSAAQLLAGLAHPSVSGFSGTVVEKASLGLPAIGAAIPGGSASSNPLNLLAGSHTVRMWYGGPTQQRVALMDSLGEMDIFRNGASVWQWNSETRTASHRTLPSRMATADPEVVPGIAANLTPDQAATRILTLIQPTTAISTDRAAVVAGRSAYVLLLNPTQPESRIQQVRISIDGKTMVPLGVQVLAKGADRPALDVAFTRFDDTAPSSDNFTWTPPAGVTITAPPTAGQLPGLPPLTSASTHLNVVGSGWTAVAELTGLPKQAALSSRDPQLGMLLDLLPSVKGSWGSGRLYESSLISVLITDDGRAFAGAVDPEVLYRAAAK